MSATSTVVLEKPMESHAGSSAALPDVRLVANMCHEIRNPLNVVLGFTQLMVREADRLSDKQRVHLDAIDQAARHILSVVNDALTVARREADAARSSESAVDLGPVVEGIMRWMEPSAAAAGVTLRAPAAQAAVLGDAQHIHEVLLNLVSNAIKYNRRGGEVRVDVRRDATSGEVCIEVQDTGCGITPDQRARLFQPFDRLGAEQAGVEGTGIGLCITQQLVHAMGGRIEIVSQPGVGTVFGVHMRAA